MLRRTVLAAPVVLAGAACRPAAKSYGAIDTKERALEVAKAELGPRWVGRPVEASLQGATWVVKLGPQAANPTQGITTVTIDKVRGRVTLDDDVVTEVSLVKPQK